MAPSFLVFVVVVTIPDGFLDDCGSMVHPQNGLSLDSISVPSFLIRYAFFTLRVLFPVFMYCKVIRLDLVPNVLRLN